MTRRSNDPMVLWLDGRLVDQHDGDVVFNRVNALAGAAFERRAVFHESDRRFTVWTRENFEQFRVDRHARTI